VSILAIDTSVGEVGINIIGDVPIAANGITMMLIVLT
jgi:hypothetical protein